MKRNFTHRAFKTRCSGGLRRLLVEAGVGSVIFGTASSALLVGQTTDGATDEDIIDGVTTLPSCLGRHISEKLNSLIIKEPSPLQSLT